MACFYCGKRHLESPEAGQCEESCRKPVCIHGLAVRPADFHADQCNCGCARLVCIYEMTEHSRREHRSNVDRCFPQSTFQASLNAAAAIEASADTKVHEATPERAQIGRAVYRFATLTQTPIGGLPLDFGIQSDTEDVFELPEAAQRWPLVAANLVPHIIDNAARSWRQVREEPLKKSLRADVRDRVEALAASRHANPEFLKSAPARVLQTWFEFSPRLTVLLLQHGHGQRALKARQGWLGRAEAWLYRTEDMDFAKVLASQMDWRAMPNTLASLDESPVATLQARY